LTDRPVGAKRGFAKVNDQTKRVVTGMRTMICCLFALVLASPLAKAQNSAAVPTFEVTPLESTIKFEVKASVDIKGRFDKWGATLVFQSPDVSTGVLEITIQSASVDTGSGMKNGKLKGKDFFDVEHFPEMAFKSTKIVQITPDHFEVDGNLVIRGVSNPEKLTLIVSHKDSHLGEIDGKMVFNRKDYGMNKGIPFISIADHVEINFHLRIKHVGGPQLALKT
jgi:polyisoprenoid-binding protein YceI